MHVVDCTPSSTYSRLLNGSGSRDRGASLGGESTRDGLYENEVSLGNEEGESGRDG